MALHVNSIALTISFSYMFCLEEKFLKNILLAMGVEMGKEEKTSVKLALDLSN